MTRAQIPMTCDAAKQSIEARRFVGWRGLPPGCAPDVLFGIKLDNTWGVMPLGSSFEKARSHLVELTGYGRALAYVRDGAVAMFDAMAPQLDGGWPALSTDLGAPEATFDWVFGTVAMPVGELVYAKRGLTIVLNRRIRRSHASVCTCRRPSKNTRGDCVRRARSDRAERPSDRGTADLVRVPSAFVGRGRLG